MFCAALSPGQETGQQPQTATLTFGQRLAADLTWTPTQREYRFGHMDALFPVNRIAAGGPVRRLPRGRPLHLALGGLSLRDVMRRDRLVGVLVLQHGAIRLEAYGLHATPRTRWTSFSVAKSFTSTLVGVALQQGAVASLNDPLTNYLPELRKSAYAGVTVQQLLTMTTGVRWIEEYTAPDSDNVRLYQAAAAPGTDGVVAYLATLPRAHAPGTVWNYNTGEADLAGVLVRRALCLQRGQTCTSDPAATAERTSFTRNVPYVLTRSMAATSTRNVGNAGIRNAPADSLSALLSTTIWQPFGMEREATWIADDGREFGGSGLNATLRDYGRFGLFALSGGADAVPDSWFTRATKPVRGSQANGRGYGMGWWTYPDGSYAALGIFGQSILVAPRRDLVVVMLGAWPHATDPALAASRDEIWRAIDAAVDADNKSLPERFAPK